jgi:23S rRNA pseudouridine2605 synthase
LRTGVTISGIHYGAIEAALERVQASNLWLNFAIREGKNREVRNVLSHLELTVTRLIRISFGPFQLGELETGAVEEIKTRVLREQLGDKLAAESDADFASPVAVPPSPRRRDEAPEKARAKPVNEKSKGRKSTDHAWRARESERPTKLLRRTFRGGRRDVEKRDQPSGEKRAGLLTDRKGRPVPVERYGQPPVKEALQRNEAKDEKRGGSRGRSGRHRGAPDRASGARPKQPRDRR